MDSQEKRMLRTVYTIEADQSMWGLTLMWTQCVQLSYKKVKHHLTFMS